MSRFLQDIHKLLNARTYEFRTSLIDAFFTADFAFNTLLTETDLDNLLDNIFLAEVHEFTQTQQSWLIEVCDYYAAGNNKKYVFASTISEDEYRAIKALLLTENNKSK